MPRSSPATSIADLPPANRIQLFGQRGSGTNFFQRLIEQNIPNLRIGFDFGYKHGCPSGIDNCPADVLVCVIVRNPFDWIQSLHRQPWHAAHALRDLPLDQFVRSPWHCIYDEQSGTQASDPKYGTEMLHERHPESEKRYLNPLVMRSDRLSRWLQMRPPCRPVWWVQYESLCRYPERFIRDLATIAARPANPTLTPVTRYKGFVGGRLYRPSTSQPLNPSVRRFVSEQLDRSIEAAIGYFP